MKKEKVLDIEIIKVNETYSFAKVKKMNRKVIEEKKEYYFGYANSSCLETNSELHNEPNFCTYISDTINCYILYLNSVNDCFTIKNNLVESLEKFLVDFNKKYGIPKRFKPKKYEQYHFITSDGYTIFKLNFMHTEDKCRYNLGNCFKTEEEAQKVIDSKEWQEFWDKVRAGDIE
ncbi:hypothetical protein [Fusobacterium pseudoperiodonticum]|uniref:hypothetical protein n=1 Tax=Fusobacterium pseudoperiodonticum TaxID=2663009 RepID=UPI0028E6D058|nr:hypothetical protein [Fusobacterium pseudoperiodonticum]